MGVEHIRCIDFVSKNSTSTQNCVGESEQTAWATAYEGNCGDISFGSAAFEGPETSFGRFNSERVCGDCTFDWPENERIFELSESVETFRMGWGEDSGSDPDNEGWYPWWQGTIWVR